MLLFWVDLLYRYFSVFTCSMASFAAQSCDAVGRFMLISKRQKLELWELDVSVRFDRSVTLPQEMPPWAAEQITTFCNVNKTPPGDILRVKPGVIGKNSLKSLAINSKRRAFNKAEGGGGGGHCTLDECSLAPDRERNFISRSRLPRRIPVHQTQGQSSPGLFIKNTPFSHRRALMTAFKNVLLRRETRKKKQKKQCQRVLHWGSAAFSVLEW